LWGWGGRTLKRGRTDQMKKKFQQPWEGKLWEKKSTSIGKGVLDSKRPDVEIACPLIKGGTKTQERRVWDTHILKITPTILMRTPEGVTSRNVIIKKRRGGGVFFLPFGIGSQWG